MKLFSAILSSIRPPNTSAVTVPSMPDFDITRYAGHWYEIARLDHFFERGLDQVTADYTIRSDGKVLVVNRGYSPVTGHWKEARALAVQQYPVNYLKVYFVPFIGGNYRILGLDENYAWAVVSGGRTNYLWFLSRTPCVTGNEWNTMIGIAREAGYKTSYLIPVSQGAQSCIR